MEQCLIVRKQSDHQSRLSWRFIVRAGLEHDTRRLKRCFDQAPQPSRLRELLLARDRFDDCVCRRRQAGAKDTRVTHGTTVAHEQPKGYPA
jgi:hypothetical protein